MNPQIAHNFKYHQPTGTAVVSHERIRAKARELADLIDELLPTGAGREKATAITNVENAMMWACAGVARHTVTDPEPTITNITR